MSHLYYWGAAIFIAAIIGFYGCYKRSGLPPSTFVRKIERIFGVGAMCYETSNRTSITFVCPVCGAVTRYPVGSDGQIVESADRLERELAYLHTDGRVPDFTLEFDKTQFCDKCTPARKGPPKLILIVHQKDEKDPHRVEGVTEDDLMLILDYIQGKTERYDPAAGTNRPMEDYHGRLNNLLGLSLSVEKQEGTTTNE